MPCIIFRNRRSSEVFVESFFWEKLVHNFVGHNVPIALDTILRGLAWNLDHSKIKCKNMLYEGFKVDPLSE